MKIYNSVHVELTNEEKEVVKKTIELLKELGLNIEGTNGIIDTRLTDEAFDDSNLGDMIDWLECLVE